MATMVCRNSQFMASPHIKLPPSFQFPFNSSFPDLDCDRHELNQILLNVLPLPLPPPIPKKPDAESKSKSPTIMPTNEFELQHSLYVHPRSRSSLSDDSLAICTENLGNETGADFLQDPIFSDLKIEPSTTRKRVIKSINKKVFPPPLTTIAGVDSIRVRSYREDGRLIMEAVKTPARLSYFHVERSNGRLRLSILKSTTTALEFDSVEESTEKVRNDDVEDVGENGNYQEVMGRKVQINGNIGGAEIEKEKFESPCRCNETEENNNIDENKNNTEMLLLTREPLVSIWVSSAS